MALVEESSCSFAITLATTSLTSRKKASNICPTGTTKKAGHALQGRASVGRDEMVVELSNGILEDLLARSSLFLGVPRLGEEGIDSYGDR